MTASARREGQLWWIPSRDMMLMFTHGGCSFGNQPKRFFLLTMSELLLLSLPRRQVIAVERAARAGDRDAVIWLEGLFEPYRERGEIPCFLCDAVVAYPPHCSIVGDLADADRCVAVPLCPSCGELPQMVRWSRVLKMLRLMHRARTGKNVHFQMRRG